MKRIYTLFLLVATAILMGACGDDSPKENPNLPDNVDESKTYTYQLLIPQGSSTTMPQTLSLDDFKKVITYKKYIRQAKVRSSSKIIISGVTKGEHELKDMVLKVKGTNIKREFPSVKKDDIYNFTEDISFIQQLMTKLVSAKKITLELTTSSTKTIKSDVKVEIQIDSQFILK